MNQSPMVRQKIEQTRRSGFEVRRLVLLRIGESSQYVLQVAVDHQMMRMRTAATVVLGG